MAFIDCCGILGVFVWHKLTKNNTSVRTVWEDETKSFSPLKLPKLVQYSVQTRVGPLEDGMSMSGVPLRINSDHQDFQC